METAELDLVIKIHQKKLDELLAAPEPEDYAERCYHLGSIAYRRGCIRILTRPAGRSVGATAS